VQEHPALTLAAAWERPRHELLGRDTGELIGSEPSGVKLISAQEFSSAACDVVIDFTAPEATLALVQQARAGQGLVIGTTGFTPEQVETLRGAARKLPIVYATNFSSGVNLLWALARKAAAALGEAFDVEIVEAHHNQKKDAPSGTAWTLYQEICAARGLDPTRAMRHGRQGLTGPRERGEIGMHSLRAGDIVGDHTVLFAGPGERLELKHQAHSLAVFARGAARAAAWIAGKPAGWYSPADVLGLK
jgi:4-hydroxy-tetrahydrodipicolinate reductase